MARWTLAQAQLAGGERPTSGGFIGREGLRPAGAEQSGQRLGHQAEGTSEEAEISSLTTSDGGSSSASPSFVRRSMGQSGEAERPEGDKWSLFSAAAAAAESGAGVFEAEVEADGGASRSSGALEPGATEPLTAAQQAKPPPSLRQRRPPMFRRKRRPAPSPPEVPSTMCDNEDSGNASSACRSGGRSDVSSSSSSGYDMANGSKSELEAAAGGCCGESNLLSENEIYSIEHCLRSHKSSIYVCGCMANLYLTSTRLVDNGRCSRPTSEGWQLSRTGVPVLTFDSGLARNRSKRRLSISLAERGSGFVLWSDIIDHLSNYRAFSAQLHGESAIEGGASRQQAESTCDTFHVMYLSSNHRIMVGLSFDDQTCARLFLRQVELVTSDPANISLTGPKLVRRLSKLSCLLSSSRIGAERRSRRKELALEDAEEEEEVGEELRARRELHARKRPNQRQELCTWSTLKRAARRFGGGLHQAATGATSVKGLQDARSPAPNQASLLQPKPLAELARAGRRFRSGERMPRKCDISAPCLFQHVTRVDSGALERLYSRSLVGGAGSGNGEAEQLVAEAATITAAVNATALSPSLVSSSSSNNNGNNSENDTQTKRRLSMLRISSQGRILNADEHQGQEAGAKIIASQSSSSSSSSCYSSASTSTSTSISASISSSSSSSPAGCECERPLPPVRPLPPQPNAPSGGQGNKIQAIIRELEAQTSSELVEAKRKLMADIAEQMVARTAAAANFGSSGAGNKRPSSAALKVSSRL